MDDRDYNIEDIKNDANTREFEVVAPKLIGENDDEPIIDYSSVLDINVIVDEVFSYVLYCNRRHLIQDVLIKNASDKDVSGLRLEIKTDTELMDVYSEELNILPAGKSVELRRPELLIHGSYIASLSEAMDCILYVSLYKGNDEVYKESFQITVLPYDVWLGLNFDAALLAAFVVPNHPVIGGIKHDASAYLSKFTGSSAFDGYQSEDPNRVINMAAALYYALQSKNIVYSEAPSSSYGQRVRLPDEILNTRLGTCLDLTLMYAACLEESGLRSLLIMIKGHIFIGLWLVKDAEAAEYLEQDPSQLDKRISDGVNEILVVECTAMCSGQNMSFDDARAAAEKTLSERHDEFELFVDVNRARRSGVKPLPIRRFEDGKYIVDAPDLENLNNVVAPTTVAESISIDEDYGSSGKSTKIEQWERKLLDFSMHNLLINVRPKSSMIPLLINNISEFEDSISEENDFEIVPRPLEWDAHGINAFDFESLSNCGPYAQILEDSFNHNKINSWWPEKELNKLITKLYRSAKSSMEENGANTLYVALGILKFYETKSKSKPRYAPLVLVPINFIRKAANKGFIIRKRDDDTEVNVTLLEYLRQVHQIDVSGLNPPPKDEKGIDVKKVFAVFRRSIMDRNGWDVIETSFIANFSFSQFVMWNDVHSRADMLAQNKIVRSLIQGRVDWDATIPEDIDDSDDTFLPVSVDASQLHAVKMAANGYSFVLHGPPGTGKSQTITAMISNALSKGKTVLFVAEKRAALEVVQSRLSRLGINDFCLELHSNKAVKREILDQLKRSIEIRVRDTGTNYDSRIERIHQMRSELDTYVQALHKECPCGLTVRELIDAYEALPDIGRSYRVRSRDVSEMTSSDFEKKRDLITKYATYGSALEKIDDNPLSFIKQTHYSHSMRKQLEDVIYDLPKAMDSMEDSAKDFAELLGDDLPVDRESWNNYITFAKALVSDEDPSSSEIESNPFCKKHDALFRFQKAQRACDREQEALLQKYNENIFSADLLDLSKRYTSSQKKLFGKNKAIESLKAELQAYAKAPVSVEQLPTIVDEVNSYKKTKEEFECIKTSSELMSIDEIKNSASTFVDAYDQYANKDAEFVELLQPQIDDRDNWLATRREVIDIVDRHVSEIHDWMNYQSVRCECASNGLEDLCKAYEDGVPADQLESLHFKAVYKALIWDNVEESKTLNSFSGLVFNEKISQYKTSEEELLSLTKEEMFCRLTQNLPSPQESPEIAKELTLLRKAISSNGRGLSIRTLFEQIPHILTRLCPCLLMSPMSVAQYLPVSSDLFDIVVFDEASQVPTSQAIGALARGKDGIIVGDPNQLPPTSFFASNFIDEDNIELEDLDSILDDCLALGMPETHLQWHYRSRHESLIAFSNREYYGEKMWTFPSVNDRERHVKLCTVNGTYCRKKGNKNYKEGEAVIKEILRRYNNDELKKQSIGVVTFNIKQRELIEDLLDEEYKKDADFDVWAHSGPEELFVKNLENVQGDERDVIIFSVGFGPDENGKILYNFGPLNKDGGWKRLNVAVSRARRDMIVFSSMTPDMINTNKTNAKGVLGLKDFLYYAQNGILANKLYDEGFNRRGVTIRLCSAIEDAGYKTQRNVGTSNMKIDIAVVNPFDEDEYLLGIVLDGDSYKRSTNTKDREVSQFSVLEGLGWRLHRVWTMDWWDNSQKEISKVIDLLAEEKVKAEERSRNPNYKDEGPESEEISFTKSDAPKTSRKKKEEGPLVTDFDTFDRFRPINRIMNDQIGGEDK